MVDGLKNLRSLNPLCWNKIQDNSTREDHQTMLSKNGRMIKDLNSTGPPGTDTNTFSGINHNLQQDFHIKNSHLKPLMEWGIIFKVSGDNKSNSAEIVIILFNLFIIGATRKIKKKTFLWKEKNQKSSNIVLPLVNHVPTFKNLQKSNTKQV